MPDVVTDLEKRIIASIQGDMPVVERPYAAIAADLEIEESRLLEVLDDLVQRGVIRRFGATLRHQKSGFGANAMTAWMVEEERIEAVGRTMATFKEVSHLLLNLFRIFTGFHPRQCLFHPGA